MNEQSTGGDLVVRNARVHPSASRREGLSDVVVAGGMITALAPAGKGKPSGDVTILDAEGRLVCPPFVDPHIHLDSVLTVGEPRHNESGTLIEGILTWSERKKSLSSEDVKQRVREAVRWEVALGTGVIRSHVDVCDPSLTALQALLEMRAEVRDIVELELIAFPQDGVMSFPDGKELAWPRSTSYSTSRRSSAVPSTCIATRPTTTIPGSWRRCWPGPCATGCRDG